MKTGPAISDFFRLRIRLWGLLRVAGGMAGTASLLGFLGSYNWFLDLFSHFRVQYFFGLSGVALFGLILRKPCATGLFGALAVLNLCIILPLYFGRFSTSASGAIVVRAMLFNVNTRQGNAIEVAAAIHRFNPDILVLEEVNAEWVEKLKPVLAAYRHFEQDPREDNFGLALFSKWPFVHSRTIYIGEAEVPSVMAEVQTPQGPCTVLATHPLPPGGREYSILRNGQLAELPQWVRRATSPVLLIGDLNVTPWNGYFRTLLRETGLKDSVQGRGVRPTWPAFNPLLRIPLDHCLYSTGIEIVNRQTGPDVGSDHFPLVVDFVLKPFTRP